jgi:hypothetical protein
MLMGGLRAAMSMIFLVTGDCNVDLLDDCDICINVRFDHGALERL